MSTIDHFKYMALLSELETKRDLKNPVTSFISKVYRLSNELTSSSDFRETARYAFMLITRAISYSNAARKCVAKVQRRLDDVAKLILHWEVTTPSNVLETYEFWTSELSFMPESLQYLNHIEEMLQVLEGKHSYSIVSYRLKESDVLGFGSVSMTRFYLLGALGEDSLVLKYLKKANSYYVLESEKLIPALEAQIERFQIILKEAHEHHSRSLTAV